MACGTGFDRGEGFFLGPMVLNYTVAVLLFVIPSIIAGLAGFTSWKTSLMVACVGCLVSPLLFYRSCWSWWLALYFCCLPGSLPANGGPIGAAEED